MQSEGCEWCTGMGGQLGIASQRASTLFREDLGLDSLVCNWLHTCTQEMLYYCHLLPYLFIIVCSWPASTELVEPLQSAVMGRTCLLSQSHSGARTQSSGPSKVRASLSDVRNTSQYTNFTSFRQMAIYPYWLQRGVQTVMNLGLDYALLKTCSLSRWISLKYLES